MYPECGLDASPASTSSTFRSTVEVTNKDSRIRHLKCSEERPSCRQCISSGFKCDGYKPVRPAKRQRTAAKSISIHVVAPLAAQKTLLPDPGRHDLKVYQRYVAPKLSSNSDARFWNALVPQMSQTEPAIRHGMVAICAVHRDIECITNDFQRTSLRRNPLVMKEASQAMQSLSQRIKSDPTSSLVPLVACLLFTCLELLCGNFETAMVHVANGFRILNSLDSLTRIERSHRQIADLSTIEKEVAPMFRHLSVLCLLFGQTHAFETASCAARAELAPFTSLEDARFHLFELFSQIFRFIKVANRKTDEGSIDVVDLIEKIKLERQLQHWYSCMAQYLETAVKLGHQLDEHAINILRVHHRTILIWLSVCLSVDGADLALHTSDFEEIVGLCESLAQDTPSKRNPPSSASTSPFQGQAGNKFSFGMGMIPSLDWVARECRDPTIRERALDLLRKSELRNSLWDAHVFSKIAERAKAVGTAQKQSQRQSFPEDYSIGDVSLVFGHWDGREPPLCGSEHDQTYRSHNSVRWSNSSSYQESRVSHRAKSWEPLGAWHVRDDSVYL